MPSIRRYARRRRISYRERHPFLSSRAQIVQHTGMAQQNPCVAYWQQAFSPAGAQDACTNAHSFMHMSRTTNISPFSSIHY